MASSRRSEILMMAWVATSLLLSLSLARIARAQDNKPSSETTNITVYIKDYDTGDPISQARVTLQFFEVGKFGLPRKVAYSAKSDTQGRCKLLAINKGKIILTVTADGHQSYGKELQLEKDNQVFEVKLKKPQPLI